MEKVVIIGAGGHSKVILDILIKNKINIVGFLDDNLKKETIINGYPVLGKICNCLDFDDNTSFVIAIGNNQIRKKIATLYNKLEWATVIHPTAVIGNYVNIGKGTVVMANSVINSNSKIGNHCIINTGSIVEHDNFIEDFVHISPGALLGGTVHIGSLTHIGIGSVIKNNVFIAQDIIVGAGTVVVKDLKERSTYIGVPARRLKYE